MSKIAEERSLLITDVSNALLELEGNKPTAYVPTDNGKVIEDSGVTIAKGVDLGGKTDAEIDKFPISKEKRELLKKLNGATGQAAADLLAKHGAVTLSTEDGNNEVAALNEYITNLEVERARKNYQTATGKNFDSLPEHVQAGLIVASFQLGNKLYKYKNKKGKLVTTDFAKELKAGNLEEAADNMATWNIKSGRGLQKRYRAQADLLRGDIDVTQLAASAANHLKEIEEGTFYDLKTEKYRNNPKFAELLSDKAPEQGDHTVETGDNITQIAKKYGFTKKEVLEANGLTEKTARFIKPGQVIKLPIRKESTSIIDAEGNEYQVANLFDNDTAGFLFEPQQDRFFS